MIKLTPSFLLFALLAFIPAKVNGTSEQEIAECKLHDRGDWLSAADIAPPEGNWFACGAKIWQTDCRFMDAMRFLYCDINNWSVQTFGPTLGNPTGDETALVTCDEGQYIQACKLWSF